MIIPLKKNGSGVANDNTNNTKSNYFHSISTIQNTISDLVHLSKIGDEYLGKPAAASHGLVIGTQLLRFFGVLQKSDNSGDMVIDRSAGLGVGSIVDILRSLPGLIDNVTKSRQKPNSLFGSSKCVDDWMALSVEFQPWLAIQAAVVVSSNPKFESSRISSTQDDSKSTLRMNIRVRSPRLQCGTVDGWEQCTYLTSGNVDRTRLGDGEQDVGSSNLVI